MNAAIAHVSDLMCNCLHWLRVPQRIQFKLCLLMYCIRHCMGWRQTLSVCQRGRCSQFSLVFGVWRPHRPESGDKVRRQSIRHLRSSDVEQYANDSQKFQHLVKLQICFEDSLVYLTIFSRLQQQLRSVSAPFNQFMCYGTIEIIVVLLYHRRIIFIIIIINTSRPALDSTIPFG